MILWDRIDFCVLSKRTLSLSNVFNTFPKLILYDQQLKIRFRNYFLKKIILLERKNWKKKKKQKGCISKKGLRLAIPDELTFEIEIAPSQIQEYE